jgi:rubrerythrin
MMKKTIQLTALFVAIVAIAVSCSSKKTVANLQAAITGESNASATYQAFSAKAAAEGYPNIAKMFAAASTAEAIHVKNHNEVLVEMGEKAFTATVGTPNVSATADNIQAAIDGETYEYTVMYPGFIEEAIAEERFEALNTFSLASGAEAVHAMLYSKVLNILKATGSDEEVASVWYTCPICGDLFDDIEELSRCPLCGASPDSFLKF